MSDEHIRVGNPEREQAISLLSDAMANGYLDVTEFEERSGNAYAARTRGELREVVRHLPAAAGFLPAGPPPAGPSSAVPRPPAADLPARAGAGGGGTGGAAAPVTYDADWGTVRYRGSWQVPPSLRVTGSMGTLDLDFRKAQFSTSMVTLELQMSVSTIKLLVGPDQDVRVDALVKTGWSSVKHRAEPLAAPRVVIQVVGAVSGMSSVKVSRR